MIWYRRLSCLTSGVHVTVPVPRFCSWLCSPGPTPLSQRNPNPTLVQRSCRLLGRRRARPLEQLAVPLAQPAPPCTPRAASPAGAALLPPRSPGAAAPLMVTRWSQKSPGLKILWIWTLGTAASNRIRHFFYPFYSSVYLIMRTHASAS